MRTRRLPGGVRLSKYQSAVELHGTIMEDRRRFVNSRAAGGRRMAHKPSGGRMIGLWNVSHPTD